MIHPIKRIQGEYLYRLSSLWYGLDAVDRFVTILGEEYRISAYDNQRDQYQLEWRPRGVAGGQSRELDEVGT